MFSLCLTIIIFSTVAIMASGTDDSILTPEDNQYFELRAVTVKNVEGQNQQVIMELWGNNIEFKRL